MANHFSQYIERKGTNSAKWDLASETFGKEGLLPMWVADSDWPTAPPIIEAIKERTEHGIFGYSFPSDNLKETIVDWIDDHYGWQIKKEWIVFSSGVVPSLNIAVRTFTNPGDEVIIQSPVYYPFYSAIKNNGTVIINNQLKEDKGYYQFNFEDLKEKLKGSSRSPSRAKMLILCSPHNPVGRVWEKEELRELGEICLENDIKVISDEIHADFIYGDNKHIPFASISEDFAENSLTFMAPSKTFNIAGFHTSFAVIPDDRLRKEFEINKNGVVGGGNIFGLTAMEAAYSKGDEWLEAQIDYLKANMDFAVEYINNNIPKIKTVNPEGTYLLWLDCNELGFGVEKLNKFFIKEVELALDPGSWFGHGGKGFMRMNLACPRSILKEGLARLEKTLKTRYSGLCNGPYL